ncbi:MAG: recombinase RecT [Selenomonadaceae bacterium]|nr:recombinase RecT [Selenomonadaceae bacterium]MBO6305632.1 recombinase RecT [Selenomonadaceae bacterium]
MANIAKVEAGRKKLAEWVNTDKVKKRFSDVLGKHADGFISSLLAVCNETPQLLEIDNPTTIIAAALQAATLKLPINKNLGFAHIVPYKGQAQFQMGWKGYVQLAERTGQYKTINAGVVYEGQIEEIDFITGKIVKGKKTSNKVIGYVAYIEMVNGFSKTLYMTKEEMEEHATKYSQSYNYDKNRGGKASPWSTNFDAMATKTVLKLLIGKYGIMSVDMESANLAAAMKADGGAIDADGNIDYVDNKTIDVVAEEVATNTGKEKFEEAPANVDTETGEILDAPEIPVEDEPF